MKIQIDTKNKTISVEEDVNLNDFINFIQTMLPDWADYKLIKYVEINTVTLPAPFVPSNPWIQPQNPYYGEIIVGDFGLTSPITMEAKSVINELFGEKVK